MTVPDAGTPVAAVPTIWGNVPQRNKNFTGRTDILTRLRKGASSKVTAVLPGDPLPQALQGLGGVGKTAIAIEYAYRYRSDYDLVWWIPADQLPLVRASLAALASRLGLEAAMATGIESAAQAVLDALRRGDPYSRWLLIFDNADQPEEIMDLIPRGPGDVVITSRNHRWQSVIDTVPTDVFIRAESTEFLAKRVPKDLSQRDADGLADKLGDLPLALVQAGAMLAETGMPVDEYLRLLDEQVTGIMSEGRSPDYPLSMTAAWKLSVATLDRQLPQARELLRCCAFFGADPIPRDVFRRGTQAAGARIAGLISDPILLARAIRELGRFALVTIDGRSIAVHRLIQALLRDELDEEKQADYRHEVHLLLAAAAPKAPDDDRLWPRYRELVAHMSSEATQLAECRDPGVREFALNMMRYLQQSGDQESCRSFSERFVAQWTEDSGQDSKDVLDARRNLGNALRGLGRYQESGRLTGATLSAARAALGEKDPMTLSLRRSFGADQRARGDFADARALDEESLALHEELYGPTASRTLSLRASLALDHGLNSDYPASRDLYRQVYLLMSEASPNMSGVDMLGTWTGLAWAVRLCGDYTEARDVAEDAWDYGRDRLGSEHVATLRSANGLCIASRRIPSVREEALELNKDIFELSGRLLGETHPDTLAIAISLANLMRTTGQLDEALELAEHTVASYPAAYGAEHPYNYGCRGNLALLRRVTGDADAARRIDEEALAGLDERLTRDHHYSLTVAANLASDLAVLGLAADARALGEGTLRRLRALLGETHPATLGCAANLSLDLMATGDKQAAQSMAADTIRRYAATVGADHPDAVAAAGGRRLDLDFDPAPI
jgi:tetratricopeptide (TPR) repeat protein